ncbi:MAG: hypothetical protein QGI11_16525 [Nitrospinota bacterium]|nr:hypothetical protein [Nitrospinota bacterium]
MLDLRQPGSCGQENDRNVDAALILSQLLQDFRTLHVGHDDIQQNGDSLFPGGRFNTLGAAGSQKNLKPGDDLETNLDKCSNPLRHQ